MMLIYAYSSTCMQIFTYCVQYIHATCIVGDYRDFGNNVMMLEAVLYHYCCCIMYYYTEHGSIVIVLLITWGQPPIY